MGSIETLIMDARRELKQFAEGRTVFIEYLTNLRRRMQRCLAAIGEPAKEELHELAVLNLSASEGLRSYYDRQIFGPSDAPGDAEFARLQKEYDEQTPPKIQQMITLLERVNNRLLGVEPVTERPKLSTRTRTIGERRKPYSDRDRRLYELIGAKNLSMLTNAELWKRYRWQCQREPRLASLGLNISAFRSSLHRIRVEHGIKAPRVKKAAQSKR